MRRSLLVAVLVVVTQGCVDLSRPAGVACDGGDCQGADSGADFDAPSAAIDASGDGGPRLAGSPCASADQCASNICADGVCCATSCPGTCVSCNIKGAAGTCVPVAPGDDPDD